MKGVQFYKKNPFKQNFRNLEMLLKKWSGVNFTKEIPLNEISEKWGEGQLKKYL